MRMALAFRRHDVDAFLSSFDADDYAEWQSFFALEPIGWPAVQMIVRRIVWAIFQRGRSKLMDEMPFVTGAEAMRTPEQERILAEVASIKAKATQDALDAERAGQWAKRLAVA